MKANDKKKMDVANVRPGVLKFFTQRPKFKQQNVTRTEHEKKVT